MSAPGSWPDPANPGVPSNPEVDGWHWFDGEPVLWLADERCWRVENRFGEMATRTVTDVAHFPYGGPVRTDADLAAERAASFKAGVEATIEVMDGGYANYDQCLCCSGHECGCQGATVHQAIAHYARALPIPDAPALSTALEQAREEGRREEREAITGEAAQEAFFRGFYGSTGSFMDSIRAGLHAIRARTPTTGETSDE